MHQCTNAPLQACTNAPLHHCMRVHLLSPWSRACACSGMCACTSCVTGLAHTAAWRAPPSTRTRAYIHKPMATHTHWWPHTEA